MAAEDVENLIDRFDPETRKRLRKRIAKVSAEAYADQNERDWDTLRKAVRDGRIKVQVKA